jgi:fatty-acyl-CoA synthase
VLPGPRLDGASLCKLFTGENVTITGAVPTVWLGMLHYLEESGARLPDLKRVVTGGAAVPRAMIEVFEKKYGVKVFHAWGMTETSPHRNRWHTQREDRQPALRPATRL